MTITAEPTICTTSTGAPLPLVALPQGELLRVNEQSIPRINDALGPGVHFQPLRLDLDSVTIRHLTDTPAAQRDLGPVDFINGGSATHTGRRS